MDTQPTSADRGSMVHCLIALALIVLAFRIGDVSPSLAASSTPGTPEPSGWSRDLASIDEALGRQDVKTAARHWQAGYAAAVSSGRWDGLVAMGDAARRVGEASGVREIGDARARTLYLSALFRARQLGTVDGVLRVAQAFADLGDREVVMQSLRIAGELAAQSGDPLEAARVRVLSGTLAAR